MSNRRSGELETYPKGQYSRVNRWFCNKYERTLQGKWEAQRTRCTTHSHLPKWNTDP